MKICSKCGFMNDNGDNYCERCGQDLNESEPIENNNSISLEEPNKKKKSFLYYRCKFSSFSVHIGISCIMCS